MKKTVKISGEELSAFCSQVALILGAGISISDGLQTIASDNEMYKKLADNVSVTGSLYQAFSEDDRWPMYLKEMTGLGERTGETENVMKKLAEHYDREARLRASVNSAIAYPLTLGAMLAVVVLILLWKVLPVFRRVLDSMGGGLTENGEAMMRIGTAVGWTVLGVVGLLLVLTAVCLILLCTAAREKVMKLIRKAFPPIDRVLKKLYASRVAGVFSMMLSSGFPMEEALHAVPGVLSDSETIAKVNALQEKMQQGEPFADAIAGVELFDELQTRMIRMGVAAGYEDQVMSKVTNLYEEQAEDEISKLVSVIEPTLVAVLSIVIGAILLCVMLPMAGILTSIL